MAIITYLTRIVFDFGALQQIAAEADALNAKRALIVASLSPCSTLPVGETVKSIPVTLQPKRAAK